MSLLAVLADAGHTDPVESEAAYRAGAAELGDWAAERPPQDATTVAMLDHSLDLLLALNSKGRRRLLRAVSAVAAHDDRLSVAEAELIRAVCATLDCPLPPILVRSAPA